MLGSIIGAASSLLGGWLSGKKAEDAADKQAQLQKQFAQSGIQWKVRDAKKAGIHPLYALGANTTSYQPVSVGGGGLGEGIANAGQDIGRAINATSPATTRLAGFQSALLSAQVEGAQLDNDIKRAELASRAARLSQGGGNPAMPTDGNQNWLIPGQGVLPTGNQIEFDERVKRNPSDPAAPHQEGFAIPDVGYTRNDGGGLSPVMSEQLADRIEEDLFGKMSWHLRNNVIPFVNRIQGETRIINGIEHKFDPIYGYVPVKYRPIPRSSSQKFYPRGRGY